jgi:hypothetical protein
MNDGEVTGSLNADIFLTKVATGLDVEIQLRSLTTFDYEKYKDHEDHENYIEGRKHETHIKREANIALSRVVKGYAFGVLPTSSEKYLLASPEVADIVYGLHTLNLRYFVGGIIFSYEDEIFNASLPYERSE